MGFCRKSLSHHFFSLVQSDKAFLKEDLGVMFFSYNCFFFKLSQNMETSNRFGVDNQYVIITISIRKVRGRCLSYQGRCLSTAITQKSTSLTQTKYKNIVIHSPQKCYHEKNDCKTFTTQTFTTPDVHHPRRSPPPV